MFNADIYIPYGIWQYVQFFFLSFLEYGELRYLELTTISLKKYLWTVEESVLGSKSSYEWH